MGLNREHISLVISASIIIIAGLNFVIANSSGCALTDSICSIKVEQTKTEPFQASETTKPPTQAPTYNFKNYKVNCPPINDKLKDEKASLIQKLAFVLITGLPILLLAIANNKNFGANPMTIGIAIYGAVWLAGSIYIYTLLNDEKNTGIPSQFTYGSGFASLIACGILLASVSTDLQRILPSLYMIFTLFTMYTADALEKSYITGLYKLAHSFAFILALVMLLGSLALTVQEPNPFTILAIGIFAAELVYNKYITKCIDKDITCIASVVDLGKDNYQFKCSLHMETQKWVVLVAFTAIGIFMNQLQHIFE